MNKTNATSFMNLYFLKNFQRPRNFVRLRQSVFHIKTVPMRTVSWYIQLKNNHEYFTAMNQ